MSGPFGSSQWMYNAGGEFYPYTIDNSCRFDNSSYLYKASMPYVGVFTVSTWVKLTPVGGYEYIFSGNGSSLYWGAAYDNTGGANNNKFYIWNGAALTYTTAVYRDYSAWYHVVFTRDGPGNAKLYINGVEVVSTTISQGIASGSDVRVGAYTAGGPIINHFSGYMADYHFVDGTAYAPTDFAQYDTQTGTIWQPKAFTGAYGTTGFHLNFADGTSATTLGYDVSGNSNNFTPSGIATTDQMLDSPTNNFCTINPLKIGSVTLSEGNLQHQHSGSTSWRGVTPTMHVSSGKWYWEVAFNNLYTPPASTTQALVGIVSENETQTDVTAATYFTGRTAEAYGYYNYGGSIWNNNSGTAYGSTWGNATIGIALDLDSSPKTLEFFLNGVSQGVLQDGTHINLGDKAWGPGASTYYSSIASYNFGQFDFTYTPPSGFLALSSANLPDPTFDPRVGASPQDAFNVYTDTGANILSTAQSDYSDGLFWIKDRANAADHQLLNTVTNTVLESNTTDAERAYSAPSGSSVAWSWKAATAFSGTTNLGKSYSGKSNAVAGISIVTYTGAGSGHQIPHNLAAVPKFIVIKQRTPSGTGHITYHASQAAAPELGYLLLSTSGAYVTSSTIWADTAPTSSYVTLGSSSSVSANTTYTMLAFAEKEGFSKFGSYEGNGNTTGNGPFVYLGFRPAFVMIKNADQSGGHWVMYDNARDTDGNLNSKKLAANLSNEENNVSNLGGDTFGIDFLSNGFKIKTSGINHNNTVTYVYAAFAEQPFKYSNAR